MRRLVAVMLLVAPLWATACGDDRISLDRGPLGPASYRIDLRVDGDLVIRPEKVSAVLEVVERPGHTELGLGVAGEEPVVAELRRRPDGGVTLDAVEGISPSSAGEADLASIVGQLDPPLPARPLRLGEPWSADRHISTDTLDAVLSSELQLVGFRRVAGADAVELAGRIRGELEATGAAGALEGTVSGRTKIAWMPEAGRVVASETRLVWRIPGAGELVLHTRVQPR